MCDVRVRDLDGRGTRVYRRMGHRRHEAVDSMLRVIVRPWKSSRIVLLK